MTRAEQRIWFEYLSTFQYPVYRQRPIDQYIVDFYCPAIRLVIEIDGDSHFLDDHAQEIDANRTKRLEDLGLHVLRFTNFEVLNQLDGVIIRIEEALGEDY
jgi:very-short-patch-repair endonuclease